MARPTKLNPDRVDRLLTALRIGALVDQACDHADITRETLSDWLEKGGKAYDLAYTRLLDLEGRLAVAKGKARAEITRVIEPARTAPWLLLDRSPEEVSRLRPLAEFSDSYKKAANECELRALARVTEHSKKEWQAAAWLLERRNPERWGRRRVEIVGSGGGPVEGRVVVTLPDNGRK